MSDVKIRKHFQLDHLVGQVKKCFRVHVNSVVLIVCINPTPNPRTSERQETPNPSPSQLHSAAERSDFELYHKRHLYRRMVWNNSTRGSSIQFSPWLLETNWHRCHYVDLFQRWEFHSVVTYVNLMAVSIITRRLVRPIQQRFSRLNITQTSSVPLSPCTLQTCGRSVVELHSFFLEVSAQHQAAAALVPITKYKGGWMRPRAGFDTHRRNISCPCKLWLSSSANTITLTLWVTLPVNGFHFWCPRLSCVKFPWKVLKAYC